MYLSGGGRFLDAAATFLEIIARGRKISLAVVYFLGTGSYAEVGGRLDIALADHFCAILCLSLRM